LRGAVERAAEAMTAFERDLERWLETAAEEFALGEEDFDFHLHYEHALRDTAPELWRYGLHLKEEVEADLGRRAARLDGGQRWQDVADRLRADHPPPPGWWKRTPGRCCGPVTSWRSTGWRRSPTPRSTSCPRRPSCDR